MTPAAAGAAARRPTAPPQDDEALLLAHQLAEHAVKNMVHAYSFTKATVGNSEEKEAMFMESIIRLYSSMCQVLVAQGSIDHYREPCGDVVNRLNADTSERAALNAQAKKMMHDAGGGVEAAWQFYSYLRCRHVYQPGQAAEVSEAREQSTEPEPEPVMITEATPKPSSKVQQLNTSGVNTSGEVEAALATTAAEQVPATAPGSAAVVAGVPLELAMPMPDDVPALTPSTTVSCPGPAGLSRGAVQHMMRSFAGRALSGLSVMPPASTDQSRTIKVRPLPSSSVA